MRQCPIPLAVCTNAFPITAVVSAWLECCGHHDVSGPHTTRSGCGGVGSPRWLPPRERTVWRRPCPPGGQLADTAAQIAIEEQLRGQFGAPGDDHCRPSP
jgi:hypothetical protein